MCESLDLPDFMQPPSAPSAYSRSPRILPYEPTDASMKKARRAEEAENEREKQTADNRAKEKARHLAGLSTQLMYSVLNTAQMRPPPLNEETTQKQLLKYRDDLIRCITCHRSEAELETMKGIDIAKEDRKILFYNIGRALLRVDAAAHGLSEVLLIVLEEALGIGKPLVLGAPNSVISATKLADFDNHEDFLLIRVLREDVREGRADLEQQEELLLDRKLHEDERSELAELSKEGQVFLVGRLRSLAHKELPLLHALRIHCGPETKKLVRRLARARYYRTGMFMMENLIMEYGVTTDPATGQRVTRALETDIVQEVTAPVGEILEKLIRGASVAQAGDVVGRPLGE